MMLAKYFRRLYSNLLGFIFQRQLNNRPKIFHKILDRKFISKFDEIIIIGDLHGCFDEFNLLLNEIHKNNQIDSKKILKIIVGDLVNKGPKNIEVLDYLIENQDNCLAIRGNHDIVVMNEWIGYQKTGQLSKRNQWMKEINKKQFEYLKQLPYTIRIPDLNILIVHAGLVPNIPLKKQNLTNLVEMRDIVIHRTNDGKKILLATSKIDYENSKPWASLWSGPMHIYFGHDARRKLQEYKFATGLDTGAVYGEELTGKFIKGPRMGEYLVVKAVKKYKK